MKKWLLGFSFFALCYLVFVIALLPASWVVNQMKLPKNVHLSQVSGRVWHANTESITVNNVVINKVDIELSLLSLFTLDPKLEVRFGDPLLNGPQGIVTLSGLLSSAVVEDLDVEVSADLIAQNAQLPVPVKAHEFVNIKVPFFELGKPVCTSATGEITWKKAAVTSFEQKVPLGDLAAKISCEKGQLVLLVDKKNDLGIELTVKVGNNYRIKTEGYIKPTQQTPRQINQLLPYLGKPDAQGRYRLAL